MSLGSSLVLYLMLGGGVAAALFVREGFAGASGVFRVVTACVFWPIYVPILLEHAQAQKPRGDLHGDGKPDKSNDEMAAAIARVENELDRALETLDGWAEDALALEVGRMDELKSVWRIQAARIRELTQLLDAADASETTLSPEDSSSEETRERTGGGRLRHSEQSRQENIKRLRELRDRMHNDLMGTLAWVRELVTMIHLAKYTGAPASRAEELVAQIAAVVEGMSEVSDWRHEPARAV